MKLKDKLDLTETETKQIKRLNVQRMHNIKCDPSFLQSNLKIMRKFPEDCIEVTTNFEIIFDYIWKGENFCTIEDIFSIVKPKFVLVRELQDKYGSERERALRRKQKARKS